MSVFIVKLCKYTEQTCWNTAGSPRGQFCGDLQSNTFLSSHRRSPASLGHVCQELLHRRDALLLDSPTNTHLSELILVILATGCKLSADQLPAYLLKPIRRLPIYTHLAIWFIPYAFEYSIYSTFLLFDPWHQLLQSVWMNSLLFSRHAPKIWDEI